VNNLRKMAGLIFCLAVVLVLTGQVSQAQKIAARPPEQIKLGSGQTLEDVAEKYFADPKIADEIRAYNKLSPGSQPEAGSIIRIPGVEREKAITTLDVAAQAVMQAKAGGAEEFAPEKYKAATDRLTKAKAARDKSDYTRCCALADETWALARLARKESLKLRPKKNRFAVSVDSAGTTRIEVLEGDGVKVTAGKKSTTVKHGQAVKVTAGKPPEKIRKLLIAPAPVLPNNESILVTASIYFSWKPVEGAARYVLLISRDPQGMKPVRQLTTPKPSYLLRSSLPDGVYYWFLRTVDSQGLVGRVSPHRRFTLRAATDGGLSVEAVDMQNPKEGR